MKKRLVLAILCLSVLGSASLFAFRFHSPGHRWGHTWQRDYHRILGNHGSWIHLNHRTYWRPHFRNWQPYADGYTYYENGYPAYGCNLDYGFVYSFGDWYYDNAYGWLWYGDYRYNNRRFIRHDGCFYPRYGAGRYGRQSFAYSRGGYCGQRSWSRGNNHGYRGFRGYRHHR